MVCVPTANISEWVMGESTSGNCSFFCRKRGTLLSEFNYMSLSCDFLVVVAAYLTLWSSLVGEDRTSVSNGYSVCVLNFI